MAVSDRGADDGPLLDDLFVYTEPVEGLLIDAALRHGEDKDESATPPAGHVLGAEAIDLGGEEGPARRGNRWLAEEENRDAV